VTYVITQSCCNDALCVDVCPVDCIHPRPDEPGFATAEQLYIDPATCLECNACFEVCPVEAIYRDSELPPRLSPYQDINAGFFQLSEASP
jgi:NAD-dependent dihydropyrimidine dehydrogenase PreA subunit